MVTSAAIVRLAASVSYILLVHIAALLDEPLIGVAAILLVMLCNASASLAANGWGRTTLLWLLASAASCGLLIAGLKGIHAISAIILVPPALISAYFLVLFGKTLLPGHEALLTRFSRLNFAGAVPPAIATYTRRLTVAWTILFAVMTVETAALAAFAELATWSWWANVINPSVALSFFFLEHAYRAVRYREWGHSSPLRTIAIMMHPRSWINVDAELSSGQ